MRAFMYPAQNGHLQSELSRELDYYVSMGAERGWSPQTTAAVVVSVFFANMVRHSVDLVRRERCLQQIKELDLATLEKEGEWHRNWIASPKEALDGLDTIVVRHCIINGMLARMLVVDKTIDIFTKSIFVTMSIQALQGVDADTLNHRLDDLVSKIGTRVAITAIK